MEEKRTLINKELPYILTCAKGCFPIFLFSQVGQ